MRTLLAAAAALFMMTAGAFAGDTEGEIKQIDADTMTITLDDGKAYKLPAEMDMSALSEGVVVIIAYDSNEGVNQITDMLIQ
jgi:outer membrane lipoprotein SlyB